MKLNLHSCFQGDPCSICRAGHLIIDIHLSLLCLIRISKLPKYKPRSTPFPKIAVTKSAVSKIGRNRGKKKICVLQRMISYVAELLCGEAAGERAWRNCGAYSLNHHFWWNNNVINFSSFVTKKIDRDKSECNRAGYVLYPRRGLGQASPSLKAPRLQALETRDLFHQQNKNGRLSWPRQAGTRG